MRAQTVVVLAIVLSVHSFDVIASAGTNEVQTIEPVPSVQSWIKQAVLLETQDQIQEAICKFKQQGNRTEEVIQQLIYFRVNAKAIYRDEGISEQQSSDRAMVAHGLIACLLEWDRRSQKPSSSSASTLIRAVLPYLGTADPGLRGELRHTLEWVDQVHGAKKDFTNYESYLKCDTNSATGFLITYMYDRDPPAALLSMSRLYGENLAEKAIADTLKGDPKIALRALADRPEWWARLYVAVTMKKQPQLGDPAVLARLRKDDNALVREMAAETVSGVSDK